MMGVVELKLLKCLIYRIRCFCYFVKYLFIAERNLFDRTFVRVWYVFFIILKYQDEIPAIWVNLICFSSFISLDKEVRFKRRTGEI